jgi:hypothetical protein
VIWTQKAEKGKGTTEKAPPGNHPAVLVALIDMGTQKTEFQGVAKWQKRAYFVWELVQEKQTGYKDKNHLIAIDLNVSLNEKAKLRKWIEARAGKQIPDGVEYDVSKELGKPCLLSVVMKNDFPKVDAVSSVPKGMTVPEPQNTPILISLDDYRGGATIPEWVPWLFGKPLSDHIDECKEFQGGGSAGTPVGPGTTAGGEEIPF